MVQEGFGRLESGELARLDLPLRFSPALCLGFTTVGIVTRSPVVFALLASVAAVGAATRRHPFDFIWEWLVRPVVAGPHLPKAPRPRRFAFIMATPVLAAAAVSLALGAEVLGLALAALQLAGCAAYVFAGWCGASLVYNTLFRRSPTPQGSPA